MSYKLILARHEQTDNKVVRRDFGSYLLNDLPIDEYGIFLFYYPGFGSIINEDLKKRLEVFGNQLGKNLLVYAAPLSDPSYRKIKNCFEIDRLPVIVASGRDNVAAMKLQNEMDYITPYVKLDNANLLRDVNKTLDVVSRIYNFFTEDVMKANKIGKFANRTALLAHYKNCLVNALGSIKMISIGILDGSFKLERETSNG